MQNVVIDKVLGPGIRVTVAMGTDRNLSTGKLDHYFVFIVLVPLYLFIFCYFIFVCESAIAFGQHAV